jgi:hypothetical protein
VPTVVAQEVKKGRRKEVLIMWDTLTTGRADHLSHDLPCQSCGHGTHTYLPCSDSCDCPPVLMPGHVA